MTPNNNMSVLPWYESLEQQNARKWWIYGRVYPLFTPAGFVLPFQLMRESRAVWEDSGNELVMNDGDTGYILDTGSIEDVHGYYWNSYEVTGGQFVYIKDCPAPPSATGAVMVVARNSGTDVVLGSFNPITSGRYSGVWQVPEGADEIRVLTYNASVSEDNGTADDTENRGARPVSSFKIYRKDGTLVGDFLQQMQSSGLVVKALSDYDVIVYTGTTKALESMENGQYYAEMSDGVETWFSEVFTVVNDISGYLRLEWWDVEDFVMDAGTIVYTKPTFRNVLYLDSDIAKPEYDFDDEVIERGGYTFPVQQVSKKRYRFSFFASEYLLDVLRFVRMADYARITANGQIYSLDTFLITPEWEDNGDVAGVDAEFTTATVAKKIGQGYIKAQRGDFNDDFNNDYK